MNSTIRILQLLALVAIAASAGLPKQQPTQSAKQPPQLLKQPPTPSASELEPLFGRCPGGKDWVQRGSSCYKLFNTNQYWYPAQQHCRSLGGHLVSINSRLENAFVGKLTYCQSAWTGGYALDIRKLSDPSNYRWTDDSRPAYNAHDFSSIQHQHQPLLTARNLTYVNNVYHAKNEYVCEVPARNLNQSCECPSGWRYLDGNCYLMPTRVANLMEANYYCDGRDAYLVSIHTKEELRAMTLLDLESYECPVETWVGLVKLIECGSDYRRQGNHCFRWQDRSGPFAGFPEWAAPPEITKDKSICVFLKDRKLQTLECHNKRRFICKKPATAKTSRC